MWIWIPTQEGPMILLPWIAADLFAYWTHTMRLAK